jgi:hypothetical protein
LSAAIGDTYHAVEFRLHRAGRDASPGDVEEVLTGDLMNRRDPIRVLVADDRPVVRSILRRLRSATARKL